MVNAQSLLQITIINNNNDNANKNKTQLTDNIGE